MSAGLRRRRALPASAGECENCTASTVRAAAPAAGTSALTAKSTVQTVRSCARTAPGARTAWRTSAPTGDLCGVCQGRQRNVTTAITAATVQRCARTVLPCRGTAPRPVRPAASASSEAFCDSCELCVVCCADVSSSYGCSHGICVEGDRWKTHYCTVGGRHHIGRTGLWR